MRRLILAGLIALLPAIAFARAPMETNQLVDGNGNPVGTADNPIVTTGTAASPTGSVTPAGTNGTSAQAVQGINGGVPVGISAGSLPLPSGAATDTSVQQVKTTLGSPFQAGGSIGNTAFGISGALPAFASTPTFRIDQTTIGTTNGVSPAGFNFGNAFTWWHTASMASPLAGGVGTFSRIPSSAATTNATVAKAASGRVFKIVACNTTTTAARIKFYDTASAPTPGTTAVRFTRPLPPAAAAGGLACSSYDAADLGWYFPTGIAYALTTGAADSDTTAVAAGAITDLSVEFQ